MRMAMTYPSIHHHLLATQIKDLMIGHPMIIASNLKSLTSSSVEIRCLLGISTFYSAFGLHLLPSMMMNHHFQRLHMCTTPSIPLLLATLLGNLLVYSIMEPDLQRVFRHGCRQSMMSGFEIPAFWSTTFSLILISSPISIMRRFKSTQLMESTAFKTSCLEIGLGNKQ